VFKIPSNRATICIHRAMISC